MSIMLQLLSPLLICSVFIASVENYEEDGLPKSWLINQPGCRIPNFDVFGPDVMHYYDKEPDPMCQTRVTNTPDKIRPALFTEGVQSLNFNASVLPFYNVQQAVCTYKSFQRVEGPQDNVEFSSDSKPLQLDRPNEISDEFVEVTCEDKETSDVIYKDDFAFLPLKNKTEERCKKATNKPSLNVMIIGLDTISRLRFHRHFNKSRKYLKEHLDAIEMMGYNKVAENTYPNLVGVLSGLPEEQLRKVCLEGNEELVDTCPLIFKKYHEEGFRTLFVEDAPGLAIFNWGAKGFRYQPTDYYLRPAYLEYERIAGHDAIGCGCRCLGSRSSLSFLLGYAQKAAVTFRDKKYFGFYWSCSATHDTFNVPEEVDITVENFLTSLVRDDVLNNTLLIVMADHGLRMKTTFIDTLQGTYENRLPMSMWVFPRWFKQKYSEAVTYLRQNAEYKLTTHFDLHRTLYDLMDLTSLEANKLAERFKEDENQPTRADGRSLFLPIPRNRNCAQARIPLAYCGCLNGSYIPPFLDIPATTTSTASTTISSSNDNNGSSAAYTERSISWVGSLILLFPLGLHPSSGFKRTRICF